MNDGWDWLDRRTIWQRKFAWIPCQSVKSGKCIWFKTAYCGTETLTGPGEPIITNFWLSEEEFMIEYIKGIITNVK